MFHPRTSPAVTISLLTLMTCFLIQSQAQTSRQTVRSDSTKSALPSKTASTDELFDTKETNLSESEMRSLIERYTVDRGSLTRSYPGSISLARQPLFRHFYSDWLAQLQKLNFDSMSQEGKVDYLLLKKRRLDSGYGRLFTRWNEETYTSLDQTLTAYAACLSGRVVGLGPEGTPAGTTAAPPNRGPGGGAGAGPGQGFGQGQCGQRT